MFLMDVLYKWVDTLKPYSNNNKKHSSKQIKMIADSISLFGFRNPIIIDKNNSIIAWHGRLLGAIQLWMQEVPTIVADDLTEEQVRAYRLLDNKIWDFGEYDMDNILAELWDIGDFQLWLDSLNDIFGIDDPSKEEIEDEVPTITTDPIVQVWDIFQLWDHRIMCWDSTKKEDVDKLMNGMKADLVVTDPPYNVDYEGKTQDALKIENDTMDDSSFLQFLIDAFNNISESMKLGAAFYIWHASTEAFNFISACKQSKLLIKQQIIWNKNTLVMWRQDYQWKHEPCLYWWKEWASHTRYGDYDKTTVYKIPEDDQKAFERFKRQLAKPKNTTIINQDRPTRSSVHPTMKPIELLEKHMYNSSKEEDLVADLFLWSWSTLIACEKTKRICYWMELDPKYIEVIIKRYYDYIEWKKDIKIINRDLDLSTITNA